MTYDHFVTAQLGLHPASDAYCLGARRTFDQLSAGDAEGCNPPKPGEEIDVEDAFVEQDGSNFYAVQGNNGRKLRRFSSKSAAEEYVDFLHHKNKPDAGSRGAAAKKKVQAQRQENEDG